MRCTVYARYSSDNQSEASIDDQVRLCRALIDTRGWTYLEAYSDRALSGSSPFRPGYQKLLEDARSGRFDAVVAEALDRLSRDQADIANLYKHLSFLGIQLITLAEGEVNELHVGLKGTMNALFLKDLALKTRRGLEGRVRQGKSGGGLCYGYDVVRQLDTEGNPVHGGRRINDDEAEVIRRIYRCFVAGKSPRAIAKSLNAENIAGPRGRAWRDTTIRGHATRGTGILRNELYVGQLVWNRQHYVKDPATGKRLARPNPREQWVIEAVPDLRIVDDGLWREVRDRLSAIRNSPGVKKARATRFWEHRRAKHLLTGLVTCSLCGANFAAVGRDYLACSGARGRGNCPDNKSIKRADLESVILSGLKTRLMDPELVKEFVSSFHAEINKGYRDVERARETTERAYHETCRKLDSLIEAIADGLRSPVLQGKLEQLEQQKAEQEKTLAAPLNPMPRLHPGIAEIYRQKVSALQETLQDPMLRDEAIGILRCLIDRVVMHQQDEGFEIYLEGDIVPMVALGLAPPTSNKKAALDERTACSVKVVAGARNQLYLLFEAKGLDFVKTRHYRHL